MRVAILGTRGIPASYSGFETAVEQISSRLVARGHEVAVYCRPHVVDRSIKQWKGARLVSITFIESYIADEHQRAQVYELNELAALEGASMKWESRVRLDVVRQNLMRMWSTT